MSQHPGIKYRPDIDGLRAIAVLAVIAFHLGIYRVARGGFVGVDIFFVISGYLITQIIDREIRDGSFRITAFYRRRALRILPAFVMMTAAVAIVSLLLLPPVEVIAVGKSIAAAALSAANVLFYFEPSSYFAGNLNARPMLHTWSLGVEEQFYFLFPLLLIAGYKLGRRTLAMLLAVLGLASFAASFWLLTADPHAAFYLLPSRFWELALGALAAIGLIRLPSSRPVRQVAGAAGLAMMLYAIASISDSNLLAYWSFLPCVGAILFILSSEGVPSTAGKFLSVRPLVWIGLISYSLYLWHWPVIAFVNQGLVLPLTRNSRLLIAAASVALAIVSWWFVERPFRQVLKKFKNPVILRPALGAICATEVLGLIFVAADGFPSRFSREADLVSAYLVPASLATFRGGSCFISEPYETFDWENCLGKDSGKPRTILLGDSHAADLWPGLARSSNSIGLRQVTATSCTPLLSSYSSGLSFCSRIFGRFFGEYLKGSHPNDTILISARLHIENMKALRATVKAFHAVGARVVIVGPPPEYAFPLPRLEFASLVRNDPTLMHREEVESIGPLDEAMHRMAIGEHTQYVSLVKALCSKTECRAYAAPNVPLMLDTDHLTAEGSRLVSPLLILAVEHPPN